MVTSPVSASAREWETLDQTLAESVWWEMMSEVRVDYSSTSVTGVASNSGEDKDEGLRKYFPNCVKQGILVGNRVDTTQNVRIWEAWPGMH
jgi:hypothetical protein